MRQRNAALWALAFGACVLAGLGHARAEQKVVIYSANDSTLNDLVFAAFTKETGIKVDVVSTGSGVLMKRIQAEKDNPQGDIIWGVSRSLLQTNKAYFAPYKSKENAAIPQDFLDPENLWTGTNVHILVVTQNTKVIPAGEGPKSWGDLLDPKYKGKIAFTDPANSGSAFTNATLLVDRSDGRCRDPQERSEPRGRQSLRRLHQPQGYLRDDAQGDLPPPGAPGSRPRASAWQHAAALEPQAPEL